MKIVYLNGRFVPAHQANVSVSDRGFLYGDAVFETVRCYKGKPFLFQQHLRRLRQGLRVLRIRLRLSTTELRSVAANLLTRNGVTDCVLRMQVSRGIGERGYSPSGAKNPSIAMTLHPSPSIDFNSKKIRLQTSSFTLPSHNPLAQLKTSNKLVQILARAEADEARLDDALLLNSDGYVAETTTANLFWIEKRTIYTAPTDAGILPGITRNAILDICRRKKFRIIEKGTKPSALIHADGVFLTSSVAEVLEVVELDGRLLERSLITSELADAYRRLTLK